MSARSRPSISAPREKPTGTAGASASPGYSLGREGDCPVGTWLRRPGGPPSNKSGLPVRLNSATITGVSVSVEDIGTFDIEIFEHEGDEVSLTSLGTVSVTASRTEVATVSFPVTTGRQIAGQVKSGTPRNIGLDIQMAGTV